MTTGRINQVTDRRFLRLGTRRTKWKLSTAPAGAGCGAADDRRALPLGVAARQVSQRQFSTVDEAPPTTSSSNATHRKGTHAGLAAANAFHSPRAMLAFIDRNLFLSLSPATNPFLGSVAPSGGEWRTVQPARPGGVSASTDTLPNHRQGRTFVGARRESRDDLCSFPHDLPGITAGLLSLTFWENSPGQVESVRNDAGGK